MSPCRYVAFAVCGLLLVALGGCDDPSGVGLDVGPSGFEGGTPTTVTLEPAPFELAAADDITGNSARILVGTVDDPIIGTTVATGYLDVSLPSSRPDGFHNAPVEKAELVLVPNYVYGDTLDDQQIDIYEMPSDWDAEERTADETIAAGTHITQSAPFAAGDTLTIDLPPSNWSFDQLSDTTYINDNFHGVQLRGSDGATAVAGYESGASYLRVMTAQDTVDYPASKSFTSIDTPDDGAPSNRLLLQDGAGQALSFTFALPDSLQNAPISRAELRLPVDTTFFDTASLPNDFVRPRTNTLVLEGFIEGEENPSFAVSDSLNAEGHFVFSAGTNLLDPQGGTVSLRPIFQAITLDEPSIERYRVTLSQANNTINPLLFYLPEAGEDAPRVVLTVTTPED